MEEKINSLENQINDKNIINNKGTINNNNSNNNITNNTTNNTININNYGNEDLKHLRNKDFINY